MVGLGEKKFSQSKKRSCLAARQKAVHASKWRMFQEGRSSARLDVPKEPTHHAALAARAKGYVRRSNPPGVARRLEGACMPCCSYGCPALLGAAAQPSDSKRAACVQHGSGPVLSRVSAVFAICVERRHAPAWRFTPLCDVAAARPRWRWAAPATAGRACRAP